MIGAAPASPFTGVPGWESVPEQQLLLELAAQVPENGVIVEIGGEFGMSASLFCKGAHKTVKVYTIDLFPNDLLEQHRANIQEAGFVNWPIKGNSNQVALTWKGQIDLLFIDGSHKYEDVLADLTNWTPFVKQGGVVVLHDVACKTNKLPHALHYEVKRALDEWQADKTGIWTFERSVDSAVVLRRIGVFANLPAYVPTGLTALPVDSEVETDSNFDSEIHEAVDPDAYTEPAPPPKPKSKRRGRPRKAQS